LLSSPHWSKLADYCRDPLRGSLSAKIPSLSACGSHGLFCFPPVTGASSAQGGKQKIPFAALSEGILVEVGGGLKLLNLLFLSLSSEPPKYRALKHSNSKRKLKKIKRD